MKKKNDFIEQEIIGFLTEAEARVPVEELCRKREFSGSLILSTSLSAWAAYCR